MARFLLFVALISIIGFTSAMSAKYPVYIVPEHRTATELRPLKAQEEIPYEYQIVPADQFQLVEVATDSDSAETSIVSSIISSIWEVLPIPSPFTAIKNIASFVLSVAKRFCAFTPFCTLVIEKPFARQIEGLKIPYLDDAEHYLRQAYDKYHELY